MEEDHDPEGVLRLDEDCTEVDWHGVFPSKSLDVRVRSKLVFSATKQATRRLTLGELLGAWDTPEEFAIPLKRADLSYELLNQAPLRILSETLQRWSVTGESSGIFLAVAHIST